MYRIVLLLLLCYNVLSQPVTVEPPARHVRQLTECCPCPRDEDQIMLTNGDQLTRASDLDDCPCRPRSTDSEGAPSILFPSTVRADGPHMRPTNSKEDPKNLLEPEVTLATSVLDTLREATEEEYRDALAREAVRNAAELDAVPEESGRNVVIIVNPKDYDGDDFISEATHIQESRCIHPLEGMPLGKVRSSSNPTNLFPTKLSFPKFKQPGLVLNRNSKSKDSDLGASSVEESIVDINGNSQRFQSHTPILRLIPDMENNLNNNDNTPLGKSLAPKLKSEADLINSDLSQAPFTTTQQQLELEDDKTSQLFRHEKLPLNLRNFLKLRDVELIPKTIRNKPKHSKSKIDISQFSIPALLKKNQNKNILKGNFQETKSGSNLKNVQNTWKTEKTFEPHLHKLSSKANDGLNSELNENIFDDCESVIPDVKLENIDTLPSPSQIQTSVIDADDIKGTKTDLDLTELTNPSQLCDSLVPKELDNTMESQREEMQNNLKDMILESDRPETITVLVEENNDEGNNHNLGSEFSSGQIFKIDKDSDSDITNNLSPLVSLDKNMDLQSQNQENDNNDTELSCDRETDLFREVEDKTRLQNIESLSSDQQTLFNNTENLPLSEALSNLRESIVKQMENLKTPSAISESDQKIFRKNNDIDKTKVEKERENNGPTNDTYDQVKIFNDGNSEANDDKSNISMNDLQDMSDKLFEPSSKSQIGDTFLKAAGSETKTNKIISQSNNINSETVNGSLKLKDACSTNSERENIHVSRENIPKTTSKDSEINEMDTEASDTVVNTLPGIFDSLNSKLRKPLLEDLVLQSPNDPLNLLGKPLGNVLNINPNLPTLDHLRERLTQFFNTNERSVEDDSYSLESDCTNDTPFENMALEASTRNSHRELPSLKQNYKKDAFRNKYPIMPTPFKSLPKTPKLTLNNYKTKVPVPNNLDLKPFKIDSLLNNKPLTNKQLLTLGFEKTSSRNTKPNYLLVNSLDSFPTLEEIRKHLRLTTMNLQNRPVDPNLNLFTENLRSNNIEDIAENFRLNTQKTMKGIHQKMKSTLKKPLTQSSLAKPQELLEDVNDKLKAIHYDLNDRISSIHENIVDSSRILVQQPRKSPNRNVMNNLRRNKTKQRPPTSLESAASTVKTQEIDPLIKYNAKQRDFTLGPESRNDINKDWNKLLKMQNTADTDFNSVRTHEKSANPSLSYLKSTPSIKQNPIITDFFKERKPQTSPYGAQEGEMNLGNTKLPIFRTASSPFNHHRQPKVSISFGTTTAKPTLLSRTADRIPDLSSLESEENYPSMFQNLNKNPSRESFSRFNHKYQSPRVPSIKSTPLRISNPVASSFNEEFEDFGDSFSEEKRFSTNSNFKPSILREMSSSDITSMRGNHGLKSRNSFDESQETDISKSFLNSPFESLKENGNAFLSKAQNANTRKSSNGNTKDQETELSEMLRSPSENAAVIFQEPLKENVSYRCKMVCTKEIR